MPARGCQSASPCTSGPTRLPRTATASSSPRCGAPSSTRSGTTSAWRRTSSPTDGSAQGPERAVPEDERVAGAHDRGPDRGDADIVVAGRMNLLHLALEPGRASVYQRNAVGSQPVRDLLPGGIHGRRAAGEPLGQKLLVAGQHADVEPP